MKIVKNENPFIAAILGKQSYDSINKYKFSQYVVSVDYDGKTLLYNTMTRKIILLDGINITLDNENPYFPEEVRRTLVEEWFLVSEKFNTYKLASQLKKLFAQTGKKNKAPIYEIFTTTRCNARCFYCFEAGMPTVDMDETTAVACADMIISENKCGITELRWFGGEPLCNDAVIDIICGRIRDSGIKYASSMITNASLFTKEIIDKATELWHLKALQVTLDGTEKVYNRVKNYKDFQCKNPYLAVIKNMNELLDKGIKVAVRLNFDLYNADNLYLLADFLSERFGEYENFFVYPYPLYENCGYKKKNRTADEKIKLIDKYIAFEEYCRSLGILEKHNIKSSYRTQHCMADNNRVTAITAEGKLAKCPHLTDDTYGNVFDKERNIANIFEWQKRITNIPECKKCFNFFDCHKIEKCPHDMVCDAPYRKLNIIRIKNSIIEEYKKSKEMAANL